MAKESAKTGSASRRRRNVVQVRERTPLQRLRDVLDAPGLVWGVGAALAFVLVVSVLANWARERPLVAVGDVMSETRTVRVEFSRDDQDATRNAREEARQRVPRVFRADETTLGRIRSEVEQLPARVASAQSLEDVDRETRQAFGLNEARLAALRTIARDEAAMAEWTRLVGQLDEVLRRRPVLNLQDYGIASEQGRASEIELRYGQQAAGEAARTQRVTKRNAINGDDAAALSREMTPLVSAAGLSGASADAVVTYLTRTPMTPTFSYDATAWTLLADEAAKRVTPVTRLVARGQTIFDRGDVLTQGQYELFARELEEFRAEAPAGRLWTRRLAVAGAVGVITALIAGYVGVYLPRVRSRPPRITWLAGLLACAVGVACVVGVVDPRFMMLGALGPVVLVAVLLGIAYDGRSSMAIASALGVIVCLALDQPVAVFILVITGVAAACVQLGDLRDRRAMVRISLLVGAVLVLGAAFVGLVDRPITQAGFEASVRQTARDALMAGFVGPLVGGAVLFGLPFIERAFDITTGMTLIELRDPKQPLLREMQQRAPGTYNHSLNVAAIAEAAADSIGADSLLTYVGCLYHDIGKINKPEYFVENQSGGLNKHDKLSPAMSLLVIIGHVKDGLEMAREHGLPRKLWHFIEGHHGTTLVEYFYNRAISDALSEEDREAVQDAGQTKRSPEPKRQADKADTRPEGEQGDGTASEADDKAVEPKAGGAAGEGKPSEARQTEGKSSDSKASEGKKGAKKSGATETVVQESQYRYPGPRPQTKEVAIVMLSDAVESATRTLAEPTPSRIDTLVRALAEKRLKDGQFDDCALTLREVRIVCDSISKTVASIYHGRISYDKPKAPKGEAKPDAKVEPKGDGKAGEKDGSKPGEKSGDKAGDKGSETSSSPQAGPEGPADAREPGAPRTPATSGQRGAN